MDFPDGAVEPLQHISPSPSHIRDSGSRRKEKIARSVETDYLSPVELKSISGNNPTGLSATTISMGSNAEQLGLSDIVCCVVVVDDVVFVLLPRNDEWLREKSEAIYRTDAWKSPMATQQHDLPLLVARWLATGAAAGGGCCCWSI